MFKRRKKEKEEMEKVNKHLKQMDERVARVEAETRALTRYLRPMKKQTA